MNNHHFYNYFPHFLLLLLWLIPIRNAIIGGGKNAKFVDKADSEFCDHEHMVYRTFGVDTQHILKGTRKFSCETVSLLKRLKLSDEQEYKEKIPTKKIGKGAVFLVAANAPYFPYLRRALHSIKKTFGREQKVIGYDLGEISGNPKMMWELRQVCGLEWRQFNYSLLPKEVRDVEIFSWKILILAEVLAEYDTVIYEDTSVNYREKEPFNAFLEEIDAGRISPFQMPSETSYSIKFQTFKETYEFFPDYTNAIDPNSTNTVEEASLIIAHRSEYTRRIMKWAVLCALTKECIDVIEPSTINCAKWTFNPVILCTPRGFHFCHLYDQTALNLLNSNGDHETLVRLQQQQQQNKNSSSSSNISNNFISRYDRSRHPRFWLQRYFFVDKRQPLDPRIDFLGDVKCRL